MMSSVPSPGPWASPSAGRRDSMRSSLSIASGVEMAQDEVFSGPMSESVPSSVVSFAHRRPREGSTVSFTYYRDEDDAAESIPLEYDEEAVEVDSDIEGFPDDLESARSSMVPKRRSYSMSMDDLPLLSRHESARSLLSRKRAGGRVNQKVYIVTEDLTAVITGFSTSTVGFAIYIALCVLSLGVAYLVFRWMPKWRLKLVGVPTPLRECQWVAIEDQWNQFVVHDVNVQEYGRPLSTVFATTVQDPSQYENEEDVDPVLPALRVVVYRYLNFVYNPLDDQFQLVNGWKDPAWVNTKVMRAGLDADERDSRELVFGQNLIDLKQPSLLQLLMNEVLHPFYIFQIASLTLWSLDEYYYYAICIFLISVFSITATILETRSVRWPVV
ncbi:hypothetical protein VTN31DRAFT_3706 [Thermomyces dupontii]|uniref:uncharacterized protein n=1 Tax=Talaromyces thermophilus TaxID=28565 RepID=UPI003742109F